MKKVIILSLSFLFAAKGFSQNLNMGDSKQWYNPKNKFLRDTLPRIAKLPLLKLKNQNEPVYKMPVVKPAIQLKYLANNHAGANVYEIQPYKMPCISPDSTFASNMPVVLKGNDKNVELGKMNSVLPRQPSQ